MPIPSDYKKIIQQLNVKSNNGQALWFRDRHSYSLVVDDKTTMTVWAGSDMNTDEQFVSFGLYDNKGTVLDTWAVDDSDEDFEVMHQLVTSARRIAHGIPDRLKAIESALASSGVVGQSQDFDDEIPF